MRAGACVASEQGFARQIRRVNEDRYDASSSLSCFALVPGHPTGKSLPSQSKESLFELTTTDKASLSHGQSRWARYNLELNCMGNTTNLLA